ncbi:endospore germination permease [Clostridium sp. DJ247]|uniref:GerAB/ArcD/ProY family transporter n=1 Tax=Clostridium sp. DJ247 TaxID=2726188 RepID=UPI00162427C3|nr:endospore germination permease [Clostridium sp. DJ247]MBC2579478.1 endospore germination permease [Clostridium sp. DJ247]
MDKFNFKYLFFVICSVSIASLKTYPEIFTHISGRDSWICVSIASLIFIIYFDYIIRIYVNNKYKTLEDIFRIALGEFLGKFFLCLFAFMLFLSLIVSASVETNVIHTNLFIETPVWYILIFVVVPGLYTVMKGKNALMIVLILCIIGSTINGINLYILTRPYKDYRLLFPVFEKGLDKDFIIGIVKSLGLYGSISITLPFLYLIEKNKKMRIVALVTNLFVAQMIIVAIVGIFATFTVERANVIVYPKLIQTQLITYFGFIASGEFYVIYQVISALFAKYIATFFALLIILKELNVTKLFNPNYLPVCVSLVVYLIAYSLNNNLIELFRFLNYYAYISIVGFIIIPVIVFTMYNIRSKSKKEKIKQ